VAVAVSAIDTGNDINPTSESVAVAVSATGALNVEGATSGESVAVAASSTGALNVDAATLGESVAVAVSAKTELNTTSKEILSTPDAASEILALYIAPPKEENGDWENAVIPNIH